MNSKNIDKNKDFEEVFLYYKSFDTKEDIENEIDLTYIARSR